MKSPRWIAMSAFALCWERDVLELFRDHEPWRAWSDLEFVDDEGRLNEVDCLVLTPLGLVLADTIAVDYRRNAVLHYLDHMNRSVGRSTFDDQDQAAAPQEDRQGLGLSRRRRELKVSLADVLRPQLVPSGS